MCTNLLGSVSKTNIHTRKEVNFVQAILIGTVPQLCIPVFLSMVVLLWTDTNRKKTHIYMWVIV